jgi:hypothetical protein
MRTLAVARKPLASLFDCDQRSHVDVVYQDWCDRNMQTFMLPIKYRRLAVLEVKARPRSLRFGDRLAFAIRVH